MINLGNVVLFGGNALAFTNNEIQLLHGSGFEGGTNSPDTNTVTTITLEESTSHSLGDMFFFVDFSKEADGSESAIYGEFFPSLSLGKLFFEDTIERRPFDVGLVVGINKGENVGALLSGIKIDLALPLFRVLSLQVFHYDTIEDPMDRDLDDAVQYTIVWNLDMAYLLGSENLEIKGFADHLGERGDGVAETTVTQTQIRYRFAPNWVGGVEISYVKNKFGQDGLDEFAPQAMVGVTY